MKKLLSLLFILLLFTSCEKEIEKPKDNAPKVNEEKIAQPIKPEIVEPEIIGAEITESTNEKHIILTLTSKNTICNVPIEITKEYNQYKFVSPEEFEWGEYLPCLSYGVKEAGDENHLHAFKSIPVILNSETDTLFDGSKKYKEFENELVISKIDDKVDYVITTNYDDKLPTNNYFLGIVNEKLFVNIFYPKEFLSITYLCDLKESTSKVLSIQANTISVSPDGKYIVFSSPFLDEWNLSDAGIKGQIKKGFYIRNIENEETVFFSCEDFCQPYCVSHNILGWVSLNKKT